MPINMDMLSAQESVEGRACAARRREQSKKPAGFYMLAYESHENLFSWSSERHIYSILYACLMKTLSGARRNPLCILLILPSS